MIIGKYKIFNSYASKNRDKTKTYPATLRITTLDGIALAKVSIESRSHDPHGYLTKYHLTEPEAKAKRQELVAQLLNAGVAPEDVSAILKPQATKKKKIVEST